jgi:antitoxin PrlF
MKATIGERGQVVIPKLLRDRFGLRPGQQLEFKEEIGRIVVTKALPADPLAGIVGILKLPMSTDELIDEMRGPAVFPPDE